MTTKKDIQKNIEDNLVDSFEIPELGDLATEYMELGLDSMMDEGLAKNIPIVNTIIALYKTGANIRDRLYVKKLLRFFAQAGKTTPQQREKFIEDNCQDVIKFTEAIMLILEQADNMEKSNLIGKIFKACILGKISYQDALSLSCLVNKALWQDINNMLQKNFTEDMKMRLCNCGLLNLDIMKKRYPAETMEPFVTEEIVEGFRYQENKYFKMLMEIAEL